MEEFANDVLIVLLVCGHAFHQDCFDTWLAHQWRRMFGEDDSPNTCPVCRTDVTVSSLERYHAPETVHMASPGSNLLLGTPASYDTFQTATGSQSSDSEMLLPWWPAARAVMAAPYFHASTQLPGKLSILIDPGAWTNLFGAKIARALTQRAIACGFKPQQHRMTRPLSIQGVGSGSQECQWEFECPIAVPNVDGDAHMHKVRGPIVAGTGSDLPGLLGLRSLEANRAILDTAQRQLIFPGPGDVKIELPPGSTVIPLEKAPSGHLVMVIDDYEHLAQKAGGLAEASLSLHTSAPETTAPAESVSAAPTVPTSATPAESTSAPHAGSAPASEGLSFNI